MNDMVAACRIIDANLNRAAEGLRVAEDYCRFVLGDVHLTRRCKEARHDLAESLTAVPPQWRAAARDTAGDVGTTVSTAAEGARQSLGHIAQAAWQRVHQALRVIEECCKLVAPAAAGRIEALRYRSYTLAKACQITADSRERLADARLYVLVDGGSSECAFVERVQLLIQAGVHVLQLRDKRLNDRTLLVRARLLRRVIDEERGRGRVGDEENGQVVDRQSSKSSKGEETERGRHQNHPCTLSPPLFVSPSLPLLIINDRPDIAVLARADGVHVGQEELTVHDARQIVGAEMLIGVSTHTIEQARQAVLDGASYIGCGPTFPSSTKAFDHFPGLDFLRQVAAEIALPAFAIGGITLENAPDVIQTGFHRVAVGSAITNAVNPSAAARALLTRL